tara:strand:- start:122 stop:394 length:273 start_codon:yes stop_codon:yes gene_type:complete
VPKGKQKPPAKEEPKHTKHTIKATVKEEAPVTEEPLGRKLTKGNKFKKVLAPKKAVGEGEWEVIEKREAFLVERPINTDSDEDSDSGLSD